MMATKMSRKTRGMWFALLFGLGVMVLAAAPLARGQAVPRYKVDSSWPKPLPNNWIMWNSTGLVVDKDDHIWVQHHPRQVSASDAGAAFNPPTAECCVPAPTYIQFDAQGNVLKSWGGPGYVPDWPIFEHGLFIDKQGNFWFGGNFAGGDGANLLAAIPKPKELMADRHVLKFSPEFKQLLEIGHPSNAPTDNQDTSILGAPAEVFVDDDAHEVYIADGYRNRRVVVYDSNTGAFKRGWGAYGIPLSEIPNGPSPKHDPAAPSKQFGGVMTSIDVSHDGLVYVGDRSGDRVQIFTKEGKYVKEFLVHPQTMGQGSIWATMFSRDAKEKFLYVSDGFDGKIWILNREDGKEVGSIGQKGHQPGSFDFVERMALDSKGNLYVTEVGPPNTRLQKFVPVK
jgi:DNA-binding beta-propeller fold protein YncE